VQDKSAYPRFHRDGDRLVKTGWSKKNRESYEHRAPRGTVIAFVRHLVSRVGAGEVFGIEGLLPVPDVSNGEVPAYQVYLTLAWLRTVGAIEKKGRDGYRLVSDGLAEKRLDEYWSQLPEHS
jgi:hypothetical protein